VSGLEPGTGQSGKAHSRTASPGNGQVTYDFALQMYTKYIYIYLIFGHWCIILPCGLFKL